LVKGSRREFWGGTPVIWIIAEEEEQEKEFGKNKKIQESRFTSWKGVVLEEQHDD
jgi:hypothetical protein